MADITWCLLFNVLVLSIGSLLFGYHIAELNAPEDIIRCYKNNTSFQADLRPCIPMSERTFGFVTSVFSVGGLLGAITAGSVSDRFGRKRAIIFNCLGFIIGPMLMAMSQTVSVLSVGRIISGISAGSSVVIAPLYIHNVAPVEHAGAFGAFTQVIINLGILLAQFLGLFFSSVPYWRLILGTGGFIGILQLLLLPFCVESPKWLLSAGSEELARNTLRKLRGTTDVEDEIISYRRSHATYEDDEASPSQGLLASDSSNNPRPASPAVTILSFLTVVEYRNQLFAVVGIMIAQQFMGINVIVMYGVSILKDIVPSAAALINVAVSLINLFVTVAAARLIDKFGRKPLLLLSILGMGLFSGLLALGITYQLPVISGLSTLLFVSSFALGLGPLPFMIASELVAHDAVGAAQSIGLTTNWLATFAVAYGFPVLRSFIGNGGVFLTFTLLSGLFTAFVVRFIPETKGKTVEEVWFGSRRRHQN